VSNVRPTMSAVITVGCHIYDWHITSTAARRLKSAASFPHWLRLGPPGAAHAWCIDEQLTRAQLLAKLICLISLISRCLCFRHHTKQQHMHPAPCMIPDTNMTWGSWQSVIPCCPFPPHRPPHPPHPHFHPFTHPLPRARRWCPGCP